MHGNWESITEMPNGHITKKELQRREFLKDDISLDSLQETIKVENMWPQWYIEILVKKELCLFTTDRLSNWEIVQK